jgi:hypothetical protein
MRLLLMLLMVALGLSSVPARAGDKAQAHVTLTREKTGEWRIDYDFRHRAPVWFFPRSAGDLDGKPWRPQSWTVETPGVRLERAGHYDVLVGDKGPLGRVTLHMQVFARPLSADYTPALAFSDGGLALYTGHFTAAPLASLEAARALGTDLDLSLPAMTLEIRDPGKRMLVRGKATRDKVIYPLGDDDDTYIYDGAAPLVEAPAFAGMIDPGLPAWVRGELNDFTPQLMRIYADRLGETSAGRPMAFVAWGGGEHSGSSMGGSVLTGMVVMQISGEQVLTASPAVLARMRWFIGHESAHFWMGQTVHYASRREAWITEGSADLLAIRALTRLAPGYDARAELQREVDECLKLVGPGESLADAEERGEHRAYYSCGALLLLAAESAEKRTTPGAEVFTFVRRLIDANRADGSVSAGDWLLQFERVTRDAALTSQVRDMIERGVADPGAFWSRLFTATGVAFTLQGEALTLG